MQKTYHIPYVFFQIESVFKLLGAINHKSYVYSSIRKLVCSNQDKCRLLGGITVVNFIFSLT